jgi:hypothetical protein
MTLFEFIDALFDKKAYLNVTDKDKKAYFFNLNRFLSNKYPLEINSVNNVNGINRNHIPYIVDYWHNFLTTKFVRKPDFFFWKTSVVGEDKGVLDKFDKDIIKNFKKFYSIDDRQMTIMTNLFPEEIQRDIKLYKDTTESRSKKKPSKK